MQRNDLLVWMDLEMTSIQDARVDRITEIAVVLTDKDLNIVAELPSIVIQTDKAFYESRKRPETLDWPLQRELVDAAAASDVTLEQAEQMVLEFLQDYVAPQTAPLCGNSIHMDRHFLKLQMPQIDQYLFYRCIDVSSIKELARRWAPTVFEEVKELKGESAHRAADDILASIGELKLYRDKLFKL